MPKKIQPLQTSLIYRLTPGAVGAGVGYVDSFRSLSQVNRKLIRQGHQLAVADVEFTYNADPNTVSVVEIRALTAGNTWIVHNAWTKGKALHDQMQRLVLKDNPSLKGKWADFKVQLESVQGSGNTLQALDGDLQTYTGTGSSPNGEWNYSMYVMPQHEVDPVTGEPLDALQYTACLIGPDSNIAVGAIDGKRSLVKAYAESRSTVQLTDPNVPTSVPTSFFNLLTDTGSQEPELADVIIDENDQPPYDYDQYPGADVIAPAPIIQSTGVASVGHPKGILPGFMAECGLIKFEVRAWDQTGQIINDLGSAIGEVILKVNYMPGPNRGLMMERMGQ
jgi:hypothetical protein